MGDGSLYPANLTLRDDGDDGVSSKAGDDFKKD